MLSIGVSMKMYFSHADTVAWCRAAATIARQHDATTTGAAEMFVLPSFPSIPAALDIFRGTRVRVGGQDLFTADNGPFTGAVSGATLRELGCTHVAVGHAERRRMFGEDSATVTGKVIAALRNELIPVLCVGEPERVGAESAARHCIGEVDAALADAPSGPVTVAYEPHWAIGAGEPAPDEHIGRVCAAIGQRLGDRGRVIYGGSAGPGLLERLGDSVDGLFLGRFAHDPSTLERLLDEVSKASSTGAVT